MAAVYTLKFILLSAVLFHFLHAFKNENGYHADKKTLFSDDDFSSNRHKNSWKHKTVYDGSYYVPSDELHDPHSKQIFKEYPHEDFFVDSFSPIVHHADEPSLGFERFPAGNGESYDDYHSGPKNSWKINSKMYDLCIIGAGMFGSAAARYASANPSLKVCLIGPDEPKGAEWKSREIFASYYDEGRIVETIGETYPMGVLSKHSISRFKDLQKLSGVEFYSPVGCLGVRPKDDEFLIQQQVLRIHNIPFADLSDPEVLKKRFPYLKFDEDDYAIFEDNGAGYINPRRLVKAQMKVARSQGCEIIKDVVEEVSEKVSDGTTMYHEIRTQRGESIRCKRVLFCTGVFTAFKNFRPLINRVQNYTVDKRFAVLLKVSEKEAKRLSAMPTIYYAKEVNLTVNSGYIIPPILYPDGNYYLKVGPWVRVANNFVTNLHEVKEWFNGRENAEVGKFLNPVKFFTKMVVPDLKVEEIRIHNCLSMHTPTGIPYIERLSPTTTIAIGGNAVGAMVSDEVGRIAAMLSISGKWISELPSEIF